MIQRNIVRFCISTLFILSTVYINHAQNADFILNAGMTKIISSYRDLNRDCWNVGYLIGGEVLYSITSNLQVGYAVAYHRYTPDAENVKKMPRYQNSDSSVSGYRWIIEFIPSLRIFIPKLKTEWFQFFGQSGFGFYYEKQNLRIESNYSGRSGGEEAFGLNLGAGLLLGKKDRIHFEILPQYHRMFGEYGNIDFVTVRTGIIF